MVLLVVGVYSGFGSLVVVLSVVSCVMGSEFMFLKVLLMKIFDLLVLGRMVLIVFLMIGLNLGMSCLLVVEMVVRFLWVILFM